MRIVIFGATGPTGRALLAQALEQGHVVTAVARNPAALGIQHAHLTVLAGDVLDQASVVRAVANQDTVFWAVGSSNVPPQRNTPSQVCTVGTQHILTAMQQQGVLRIISLSSWGVGDSMARVPLHFRYLILPLVLGSDLADKARQEALLRQSDRDWTIVRPARLTNRPALGRYHAAEQLAFRWNGHLARVDLAAFMLRELAERRFVGKVAEISA
ncbi:MAG: SDR family oxidoreductase [Kouleothrix sp.]|jgi:uncharacterized protein YbjT (DUF2867 family)|nr:SDR family oxidoreductase [Kouleothrix sp.]